MDNSAGCGSGYDIPQRPQFVGVGEGDKMKEEMSDLEFAIQMLKILLGVVLGIVFIALLLHINTNITTLIKQQGQIIELLKQ